MGANKSRYVVAQVPDQKEDLDKYNIENYENERKEVCLVRVADILDAENEGDSREDSLDRANRERTEQACYGGEADLKHHFKGCEKNPGHLEFFPADQFTIDCLPSMYQDDVLADCITALSKLTVRVTVKTVSDQRPETYPGTQEMYPGYAQRGNSLLRTGSGWISGVRKRTGTKSKHRCTCKDCRSSPGPQRAFACIEIKTASIVVFDDIEGADTSCDLFFDKDTSLDKCQDAITLRGMSSVQGDIASNTCRMTYVTHDMDLAGRLGNLCRQSQAVHQILMNKYSNDRDSRIGASLRPGCQTVPREHTLTVIVSHPHGCSKQVSIGRYTKCETIPPICTRYTYSTATCPGSSGARVYVLGNSQLVFDHAHVGSCPGDEKRGYSSYGLD